MTTIVALQRKVENLERELAALRSRVVENEGVYVLSDVERREVKKGLSDRFATDEEVNVVLSKYGLQDTL